MGLIDALKKVKTTETVSVIEIEDKPREVIINVGEKTLKNFQKILEKILKS